MENQIGFVIPAADLHRSYLSLLPWALVGLAVPFVFGVTSLGTVINSAFLLAVIVGGVYWFTLRYKWIFLSSSGIHGLTRTGATIAIQWSEPLHIGHCVAFNGIACIKLTGQSNKAALLLPASIAATLKFNAALKTFTSPDHPLRVAIRNAS